MLKQQIKTFQNGKFEELLTEFYKKKFTTSYFTPSSIGQKADSMASSSLTLTALNALRECEGLEPYERGILPSASSVSRLQNKLHLSKNYNFVFYVQIGFS